MTAVAELVTLALIGGMLIAAGCLVAVVGWFLDRKDDDGRYYDPGAPFPRLPQNTRAVDPLAGAPPVQSHQGVAGSVQVASGGADVTAHSFNGTTQIRLVQRKVNGIAQQK